MKLGLVITIYNRPEYLAKTFNSLKKSQLPPNLEIFMIDDCSTDKMTNKIFKEFCLPGVRIKKIINTKNENMFYGLKKGFDYFYASNTDVIFNLDSDVTVKPYWINILLQLLKIFPHNIISGFNTPQHPISDTFHKYHTKKSVGGVNILFNRKIYPEFASLIKNIQWDWDICYYMQKQNRPFIVSNPSVVQHIGELSTLREHRNYDVALDY